MCTCAFAEVVWVLVGGAAPCLQGQPNLSPAPRPALLQCRPSCSRSERLEGTLRSHWVNVSHYFNCILGTEREASTNAKASDWQSQPRLEVHLQNSVWMPLCGESVHVSSPPLPR